MGSGSPDRGEGRGSWERREGRPESGSTAPRRREPDRPGAESPALGRAHACDGHLRQQVGRTRRALRPPVRARALVSVLAVLVRCIASLGAGREEFALPAVPPAAVLAHEVVDVVQALAGLDVLRGARALGQARLHGEHARADTDLDRLRGAHGVQFRRFGVLALLQAVAGGGAVRVVLTRTACGASRVRGRKERAHGAEGEDGDRDHLLDLHDGWVPR